MNRRARQAQIGVAAAALALFAGCSVNEPLPSATPTASPAEVRVTRVATIPDVHVPGSLELVAGTGTRFLLAPDAGSDGPGRYTPDNGRTWQDAPAELSLHGVGTRNENYGNFLGYDGTFFGVRQEPEPDYSYSGFQRWDPQTGAVTTFDYDLDPELPEDGDWDIAVSPIDYIGSLVLLNDSRIFDVSGEQAVPVEPRLPAEVGPEQVGWSGLTRNGEYVVGGTFGDGVRQLVVGAIEPTGTPSVRRMPGLLAVDVSADRIHYLVGTAVRLQVCRAEVATPDAAACVTLAAGDYRPSRYIGRLSTSDGADQVTVFRDDGELTRYWFVRGSRVASVSTWPQDQPTVWEWLPFRDSAAPMALVRSNDGLPDQAMVLADDGTATPLFAAPAIPATPYWLRPSADRVVYQQLRGTADGATRWRVWLRSLRGGVLGEESLFTDRRPTQVLVSGDRTALQWDRYEEDGDNSIAFYDGLEETGTVKPASTTAGVRALSGPYARLADEFRKLDQQVVRVDGHGYDTGLVTAIFGSLVIEASQREPAPGRGFTLRDLARPEAEPIPLDLPGIGERSYRDTDWWMWGEWIAASYEAFAGYPTVLLNYRTGESIELPEGSLMLGLGDGWVLLGDIASTRLRLRILATGEEIPVTEDGGEVSSDGTRTLAWAGLHGAEVATIEGLPAPVPRLLGALGASTLQADGDHSWTPRLDLTAPTGSGTLTIADAEGTTVASLPIAAAPGGSIRDVSWDGRDAAGDLVAPGDYTWTLDVDGATSVDGLRPASGPLAITR